MALDYNEILKQSITNKDTREFFKRIIDSGMPFQKAFSYYELYHKNETLMKNNDIIPKKYNDLKLDINKCFENFTDDLHKSLIKNNAKKNMKAVFSKKYQYLINEETESIFLTYSELNFDKEYFIKNFGRKIAAFKSPDELNDALRKDLIKVKNWSFKNQINKIKNFNVDIINQDENSLIFEVLDYNACKSLGTDMWCIVRDKDTFIDYRSDADRVFFKYDFNYNPEDNSSMTAYIVTASGEIRSGYYKDDTFISDENLNKIEYLFNSYSYDEFSERLSLKSLSEGEKYLYFYKHNMQELLKDNVDDFYLNITKEEIQHFINSYDPYSIKEILKDKDIIFGENKIHFFNEILDLSNGFRDIHVDIVKNILEDKDFKQTKRYNDYNTFSLLNEFFYFKYEDFENYFLNKRNKSLTDEFLYEIKKDKNIDFLSYENKKGLKNIKSEDLFDIIKDSSESVISSLFFSYRELFDKIIDSNKHVEEVYNIIKKDMTSFNFEKIHDYCKEFNYIIESEELDAQKQIINYCLEHPNKLFIKLNKIDLFSIKFNYEESINILNKSFFENDNNLDRIEDFISPCMNPKNEVILFNHNSIDKSAINDFLDYVSNLSDSFEHKYKADVSNKIKNIKFQRNNNIKKIKP